MKAADTKRAAALVEALKQFPTMRAQVSGKIKSKRYDGYSLELSSSEMSDGEGQGSNAYFYLDGAIALKVLDYAEELIRGELKALGVTL